MTGGMVDVALRQTHETGLPYAVVPLPWLELWLDWIGDNDGSSFRWWDCCGLPGWDFRQAEQDGDGNVWLCLLKKDDEAHTPWHSDDVQHGWCFVKVD